MGGNRVTIGKDECHDVTIDNDECHDVTINRDITDGRWNTYVANGISFFKIHLYPVYICNYCNSLMAELPSRQIFLKTLPINRLPYLQTKTVT